MGWLCVPDQLDPTSRASTDASGSVFGTGVRRLQHPLLYRHHSLHADLLCRFPTGPEF